MFPPTAVSSGLPRASAQYATVTPQRNRKAIAAHTAQPCARAPVIEPRVYVRPDEIAKIANIARKFDSGVGFSKGCALLALKKPPPLVPNCLIASCDATGPWAIVCFAPSNVCATSYALRFCTAPCERYTSAPTRAIGNKIQSEQRTRSTQ